MKWSINGHLKGLTVAVVKLNENVNMVRFQWVYSIK